MTAFRVMALIGLCVAMSVAAPVEIGEGKEPQLAVDPSGRVYVTYARGEEILVSASADGGKKFEPAGTVAKVDKLMAGMRRGPRIVAGDGFLLVTAIAGDKAKEHGGDLVVWRSTDGGKRWDGPAPINDVRRSAREGLHHFASDGGRRVYAVWLDLRTGRTRVVGALSRDGGVTWDGNEIVYESPDGHVCECCQPSVVFLPDGKVAIMFRNWLGGNRDMYLARFTPGAAAAGGVRVEKVGSGSWPLNACPMDGGALSVDAEGSLFAFWRRDKTLYLSTQPADEQRVADGIQGWIAGGRLVWATGRNGKLLTQPIGQQSRELAAVGTNPVLVEAGGRVIAAWEANGRVWTDVLSDGANNR